MDPGSPTSNAPWMPFSPELAGLASQGDGTMTLTDAGAFWLHLAQNCFTLEYVNTLWTAARRQPWPAAVSL